jgi:hypothetical protein
MRSPRYLINHNREGTEMDKIDAIAFLSWSAMLCGLLDINGFHLMGCQAAWLGTVFICRKLVDRYVEHKYAAR